MEVGPISCSEMEEDAVTNDATEEHKQVSNGQDHRILAKDGCLKGWVAVEPPGENRMEDIGEGVNTLTSEKAFPAVAVVEGDLTKPTEG